jgi:putative membrane protein insertion efficiency factor
MTVTSHSLAGRVATAAVLGVLAAYKSLFSPLFAGSCRFEPSCSDYMSQAVRTHGAMRGTWLGMKRLARCRPFGGYGVDPCPPADHTRGHQRA